MKRPAKTLLSICLLTLLTFYTGTCHGQNVSKKKEKSKIEFHFDQYVMVKLKDGSEVPAKISSRKSKSVYLVKMIGGSRVGAVNQKFIRAMKPAEIQELKEKSEKNNIREEEN